MSFLNTGRAVLEALPHIYSGGVYSDTLTGNVTLDLRSSFVQQLDPGGSTRTVTLPSAQTMIRFGAMFLIENTADAAGEQLTVQNDTPTTIITLDPGATALVLYDGSAWSAVKLGVTDLGATGLSADVISESTSGAGVTVDGLLLKDGEVGPLADSARILFGAGSDIGMTWDGTRFAVTQATVDSEIRWGVDGAGMDQLWYGDTASANMTWDQSQDALIFNGAAVTLKTQASSSGVKTEVIGPDLTHGMVTEVYEQTVSPAAIETMLITLPANSQVLSVQANIESALTGGGSTATVSIGITGDVDKFGTVFASGSQADALTQNAKIDVVGMGSTSGAGVGLWNPAAVAVKLIGAATGGASAGDTALTVGSVKVRIIYRYLLSIADT